MPRRGLTGIRPRNVQGRLQVCLHGGFFLLAHWQQFSQSARTMSRLKAHYSVTVKNHLTGEALRVDLVDLPFPARSFRLRVNGRWAERIPVGSRSTVLAQVRTWWVAHRVK